MKKLNGTSGTACVLALFCISAIPVFGQGSSTCIGDTVTTVTSNLDVPAGATCRLFGVEVHGNVTVEGTLVSFSAKFDKNVSVIGGTIAIVNGNGEDSALLGNLTITGSTLPGGIFCPNSTNVIGGNLTVAGNSGGFYVCSANVGGNVTVSSNTGRIDLNGIHAGKNLSCDGNDPAPIGTGNQATHKNGQCAGL